MGNNNEVVIQRTEKMTTFADGLFDVALITSLEVALFSDNLKYLEGATKGKSDSDRRYLVRVSLILGTPLNLICIGLVQYISASFPWLEPYINVLLGCALIYLFGKGIQAMNSEGESEQGSIEGSLLKQAAYQIGRAHV